MHPRYLSAAVMLLVFLPDPSPISAQSTEARVAVRIQAAHEVVREAQEVAQEMKKVAEVVGQELVAFDWDFFLDPRTERRQGFVASLAFDSLVSAGLPVYDRPEIPGPEVRLLSTRDLFEDNSGLTVSVRVHSFREYSQSSRGVPYRWGETVFRVTCDEESCALGDVVGHAGGLGVVREECMADYFALSAEEREGCRAEMMDG